MSHLIICGAPRSGTTSLFKYLSIHPDVNIPKFKELNFFNGGSYFDDNWSDDQKYHDSFITTSNKVYLEASPAYMHPSNAERVALRMKSTLDDVIVVFIIREPIARLYSQYQGLTVRSKKLRKNVTFDDFIRACIDKDVTIFESDVTRSEIDGALEGVEISKYFEVIKKYSDRLSNKNVKLVFQDDLSKRPMEVLRRLCYETGIDHGFYDGVSFEIENRMIAPRSVILYRLSLLANRFFSNTFRDNPRLKSLLREIHNFLNERTSESEDLSHYVNLYKDVFVGSLTELKSYMEEQEIKDYPEWIEGYLVS